MVEIGDFGMAHVEVVLFEPRSEVCKIYWCGLIANGMCAAEVVVEVLIDVNGGVTYGVVELIKVVTRWHVPLRALQPCMTAGIPIARSNDELLGAGLADAVDCGLVILKDQARGHIVRLFIALLVNGSGWIEKESCDSIPHS